MIASNAPIMMRGMKHNQRIARNKLDEAAPTAAPRDLHFDKVRKRQRRSA